ncbi:hypothetical protein DY000_02052922 [Brassica cretica]|uniref:Uncharacterized protein n=1 Tax=Brassica cretica TaxID=69181 RepID=A0ABQ7AB87_BRACR|nr:hypothetical protein DY000_02052922 [Brassica cretica]
MVQVGQCRCDDQTKGVIMTLMMSVKSACELGWFTQRESQQLLALVDSVYVDEFHPVADVRCSGRWQVPP